MPDEIILYGDSRSGNCYKLQLLCSELGIGYAWREVDILAGDTRTPEFLQKNPNGRIPLLQLPGGEHLAESNAILCYMADGSNYLGHDAWSRAKVMQWLFFEQYSHEPYIATSRFIIQYLGNPPDKQHDLEQKKAAGMAALQVMDQQLEQNQFMAGDSFSIADIALFAYTHVADEGGFDLQRYPAVLAWLDTVGSRPGFTPMVPK